MGPKEKLAAGHAGIGGTLRARGEGHADRRGAAPDRTRWAEAYTTGAISSGEARKP